MTAGQAAPRATTASPGIPDDIKHDPLRRREAAEAADARDILHRHAELGTERDRLPFSRETAEQAEYAKMLGKDPGTKKSDGFPTYHLASVGWLRKHLGWSKDSASDEEPG